MKASNLSRQSQSAICFGFAVLGFMAVGLLFPPSSTPRGQWPAAFLVILLSLGMIGGSVGALFGRLWTGFLAGFVLPIIAFFAFGVGGMLC